MAESSSRTAVCADCNTKFEAPNRMGPKPKTCAACNQCAVVTCRRPAHSRGWCKNHYERVRRYGDVRPDIPLPEEYPTICSVDGCERTGNLRLGLCGAHRTRLSRTGETGSGELRAFTGLNKTGESCLVDTCNEPMHVRGWCHLHYSRWQKHGRVEAHVPARGHNSNGTCYIKRCDRSAPPGEWCNAHYFGWLEGGGLPPRFRNNIAVCVIESCDKPEKAYGWCGMHASRWQKHCSTLPYVPARRRGDSGEPCEASGCRRPRIARGLCRAHYAHYRKAGQIGNRLPPTLEEIERRLLDLRERDRINSRARWARDPELNRARSRSYRAANRDRMRVWDRRKRAKRYAAPRIPFSVPQLAAKMSYWGNRCWMCGGPFEAVDHVKPLARGGWDILANLRPSCQPCNNRKYATWPFPVTYSFLRAA